MLYLEPIAIRCKYKTFFLIEYKKIIKFLLAGEHKQAEETF